MDGGREGEREEGREGGRGRERERPECLRWPVPETSEAA